MPWIKGCTGITRDGPWTVDDGAKYLATETGKRVGALRTQGIDVRCAETVSEFKGHSTCTGTGKQWINSLQKPITEEGAGQQPETFHPNANGQLAYVRAVQKVV